jgi:DNA-binding MarR family transcriptional regulator
MNDPFEEARRAYVRAIGVTDPFRLRFWDSRGVTMTQLRVMHLVRVLCEPSTGELAEQLHIRPATLTGLADRLELKGFIHRWPDASDRRVVRVGLTDEGTRVLAEAHAAGRAYLDIIFEHMGAEAVQEFVAAMEAFSNTADEVVTYEPVDLTVEAAATDDP